MTSRDKAIATFYSWNPTLYRNKLTRASSCRWIRTAAIDNFNVLGRPTQDNRPLTQRILALRTLGILKHLTQRRLPNVEIGRLLKCPGVIVELEFSAVTLIS